MLKTMSYLRNDTYSSTMANIIIVCFITNAFLYIYSHFWLSDTRKCKMAASVLDLKNDKNDNLNNLSTKVISLYKTSGFKTLHY